MVYLKLAAGTLQGQHMAKLINWKWKILLVRGCL